MTLLPCVDSMTCRTTSRATSKPTKRMETFYVLASQSVCSCVFPDPFCLLIDFRAFRLVLNCSVFITIIIMSVLEPLFDELIRSYNQQLSAGSPGLLSLLEGLSPLFHDESHMIYNDNGIHSLLNVVVFVFVHLSVLPSCSSQRRQL